MKIHAFNDEELSYYNVIFVFECQFFFRGPAADPGHHAKKGSPFTNGVLC